MPIVQSSEIMSSFCCGLWVLALCTTGSGTCQTFIPPMGNLHSFPVLQGCVHSAGPIHRWLKQFGLPTLINRGLVRFGMPASRQTLYTKHILFYLTAKLQAADNKGCVECWVCSMGSDCMQHMQGCSVICDLYHTREDFFE